jgi:hypothetical protein
MINSGKMELYLGAEIPAEYESGEFPGLKSSN